VASLIHHNQPGIEIRAHGAVCSWTGPACSRTDGEGFTFGREASAGYARNDAVKVQSAMIGEVTDGPPEPVTDGADAVSAACSMIRAFLTSPSMNTYEFWFLATF
jgi:hypothetical protein